MKLFAFKKTLAFSLAFIALLILSNQAVNGEQKERLLILESRNVVLEAYSNRQRTYGSIRVTNKNNYKVEVIVYTILKDGRQIERGRFTVNAKDYLNSAYADLQKPNISLMKGMTFGVRSAK